MQEKPTPRWVTWFAALVALLVLFVATYVAVAFVIGSLNTNDWGVFGRLVLTAGWTLMVFAVIDAVQAADDGEE